MPYVLITKSGDKIRNVEQWEKIRRPEILELFKTEVYGKVPKQAVEVKFHIVDNKKHVLDGLADRKQIKIIFSKEDKII